MSDSVLQNTVKSKLASGALVLCMRSRRSRTPDIGMIAAATFSVSGRPTIGPDVQFCSATLNGYWVSNFGSR